MTARSDIVKKFSKKYVMIDSMILFIDLKLLQIIKDLILGLMSETNEFLIVFDLIIEGPISMYFEILFFSKYSLRT